MIDTQLINKAKNCSPTILAVDHSWREYVDQIRKDICTLPFKGNYSLLLKDGFVLVEGYSGTLRIGKLYHAKKTYSLKRPVVYDTFRVYGVYDHAGRFIQFSAQPPYGFHYLGMNGSGYAICTGDLKIEEPKSIETLKKETARIVESFNIINMQSLGKVFLPDGYEELKAIFNNENDRSETKVEQLIKNNLIQELLA